jgi:hypothetical protein
MPQRQATFLCGRTTPASTHADPEAAPIEGQAALSSQLARAPHRDLGARLGVNLGMLSGLTSQGPARPASERQLLRSSEVRSGWLAAFHSEGPARVSSGCASGSSPVRAGRFRKSGEGFVPLPHERIRVSA